MNWTKVSVAPIVDAPGAFEIDGFQVFGWSGGYVAFGAGTNGTADASFIATSYSADGLRWKSGVPLDTTKLPEGPIRVGSVVEGPAGLLAVGTYSGAACGPMSVPAMWISSDGISWHFVSMATAFGGGPVIEIEAGSAGYIATGYTRDTVSTPAVWTSMDGLSWRQVNVRAKAFGGLVVNNATAFAGGYVLAGAARTGEFCGGLPFIASALWWSPDGLTWSRDKVPGTTNATDATMRVLRISDHALFATEWGGDPSSPSWTSTDGRTWKPAAGLSGWLVTNGRRGLSIGEPYETGQQIEVSAFQDDLSLAKLAQRGDVPDHNTAWGDAIATGWPSVAFGPTGLLVANSAGDIWIGIPVAG
jgi:hypothetical protein